MRVVVGVITGIFISLYLFYYVAPLLVTEHTNFSPILNASDPVIANSFNLGAGFYASILLIPILIGGFLIISYALKGEGSE